MTTTTRHAEHRMANRSISVDYLDVLEVHGEYLDQKGSSYVLSMQEDCREELLAEVSEALKETKQLLKVLKRKQRALKKDVAVIYGRKSMLEPLRVVTAMHRVS